MEQILHTMFQRPLVSPKLFEKIDFKVSFSNLDDETTKMCDLVIPDLHPFEKWGDYEGVNGNLMVIQPVMKPLYDGISSEEVLVGLFNRIQSNLILKSLRKVFTIICKIHGKY